MKKILKIITILSINFFLLILLVFISDLIIYNYNYRNYDKLYQKLTFKYLPKVDYLINIDWYFDGSDNVYRGRKPDGLEYKKNKPIVIFGCSFTQGQFLNYNQTISYKLAHILHRPVYNRGISAKGIQHMYWQTLNPDFYRDVPPSEDVMYLMIGDHYRRLHVYFMDILDHHFNGHFSVKNNDIILDNDKNPIVNILKSSYTFKLLNFKYANFYVNNPKNADKITDDVLLYFIKTRENLEKNWNKKINFTVILFDEIKYKNLLIKKLKDNNFNIIETTKLTNENLWSKKYFSKKTNHPSEAMWDLLTPLIAQKIKENK